MLTFDDNNPFGYTFLIFHWTRHSTKLLFRFLSAIFMIRPTTYFGLGRKVFDSTKLHANRQCAFQSIAVIS